MLQSSTFVAAVAVHVKSREVCKTFVIPFFTKFLRIYQQLVESEHKHTTCSNQLCTGIHHRDPFKLHRETDFIDKETRKKLKALNELTAVQEQVFRVPK